MDLIVPYAVGPEQVVAHWGSHRATGLPESEVPPRLARHGYNELAEPRAEPRWKKFVAQFRQLVVLILVAAAILAGVLGEWVDTLAIMAIVLLNGVLGFLQEERAERALAALERLGAPSARVVRDGKLMSINARELVPGDRLELEAGDRIPADARLLEGFSVRVQEAALTGESEPVDKDAECLLDVAAALGDRRNMVYMGTVIAAGKGAALVVATGMRTELGHIANLLVQHKPEPTPLERRLTELGKVLIVICLVLVGIIFSIRMLQGGKLVDVLLSSVSLAVAAVPEGLPAVVTISLALGLQRMVKRNALVRKLPSVETLGSVTVICSDKTGTLTRNEMTVREVLTGGNHYRVTGVGYSPEGEFLPWSRDAGAARPTAPGEPAARHDATRLGATDADLLATLRVAVECNHAQLRPGTDDRGDWNLIGDPTEGALLALAMKGGVQLASAERRVLHEIPFDSQRKTMSIVVRSDDGDTRMFTKGAPEVILERCTHLRWHGEVRMLTDELRAELNEACAAMAASALRVLALAERRIDGSGSTYDEQDLTLNGMVGMMDPPRPEAGQAVLRCRQAGIRPIMITGDHPATAQAIARELQLATAEQQTMTGQQLDQLSDAQLAATVEQVAVYARVSAEHKLRIVNAWKSRNQVVAMTGDGVNDAPAVKAADIGIAMGASGTDVTKEASDMVLLDDNFTSIVAAIEEGRGIFNNIQKFVHYLLACNTGEVLFMFVSALLGWPAPLVAVQILWINLVTDGLPALALAMEPPERDIMCRAPRPANQPVITWRGGLRMLFHGALIAGAALAGFWHAYAGVESQLLAARSSAFCIMAFSQLAFSFACRSHEHTLPELGLFSNPALLGAIGLSAALQLAVVELPLAQSVFETIPHTLVQWTWTIGLALVPVTIVEVLKLLRSWLTPGSFRVTNRPGALA